MNEKNLLHVSLVCSLIGLAILFFLQGQFDASSSLIQDVEIGDHVKISGAVIIVKRYETIMILKVKDESGIIDVMMDQQQEIQKGSRVEVIGKVSSYKGRKQVEANQIRIVSTP